MLDVSGITFSKFKRMCKVMQTIHYIGITISSVMYKAIVSAIEKHSMDFIESNNLLTDFQGAFRKKPDDVKIIYLP